MAQVKVAILSGKCEEGSAAAIEALALGASDIVSKPGSGSFGEQFPEGVDRAPEPPVYGPTRAGGAVAATAMPQPVPMNETGRAAGRLYRHRRVDRWHPCAGASCLKGLAAPLGVPVLLTQHLPASFTVYFAQQLSRMTSLKVKVAETGDVLMRPIPSMSRRATRI